jgi:hypothetical protein
MNAIPLVELYAQEASHNRNRQSFGNSIIATENGRGNDSGCARASLLGRRRWSVQVSAVEKGESLIVWDDRWVCRSQKYWGFLMY